MRKEAIKRLLVRAPNWIGDAVMCEPAITALRSLFPAAEMALLVKPAIGDLFKGHPAIDRTVTYEDRGKHGGLAGKWELALDLRRQRFDLAILFQNAFEAALLAFLAGIPRRYGYATDGRSMLLSHPVAGPPRSQIGHQVRYYFDMLRPLGVSGPPPPPRLFLSEQEGRACESKLGQTGISPADLVVGLNPGSTYGGAKRWLPERFAETADRLVREAGAGVAGGGSPARVVIVGARGEEALGRTIAGRMKAEPIVLSGQTSIRELMAVIKRCGLFITNDTGPMHIAGAFGVPVVAVFGPTDSRTTSPFGQTHTIVRHPVECAPCLLRECPIDHRCMTGITVDDVYAAAVKQLTGLSSLSGSSGIFRSNQTNQTNETNLLKGVTVFLDRDGTVNRDHGYVKTPDELDLFPGVVEAVARLNRAGARVVLITNQSGIARGFFSTAALEVIHARLRVLLEAGGASLDGIYYCPHHPDDGCVCRKPRTAMIDRAMADLGLDPLACYVVGDQRRDIELARRIGARSVLVTSGPTSLDALAGLEADRMPPDHVAAGLAEAVGWILEDAKPRSPLTVQR